MSRSERKLQKRFVVFCEGDTDVKWELLNRKGSNMEEFFDVIDW